MKQPVLGKKVLELRLAKGMTQSELAEKCNISLRTIQRIESADVMPRSYTVKLIFSHLGFEVYDSPEIQNQDATSLKKRLVDLFNLKTHTMKKLTILSIPCLSLWLLFLGFSAKAQDNKVEQALNEANTNLIAWYNSGKIDSVVSLYSKNSVVMPPSKSELHGKTEIKAYYLKMYESGFRLVENKSKSIQVTDTVAIDRGVWAGDANGKISGTYLTQWKLVDGKWMIENEMTSVDFVGDTK